jgi:hypothetical protein
MCRVLLVKTLRKTDSEANVWYRIKKRWRWEAIFKAIIIAIASKRRSF